MSNRLNASDQCAVALALTGESFATGKLALAALGIPKLNGDAYQRLCGVFGVDATGTATELCERLRKACGDCRDDDGYRAQCAARWVASLDPDERRPAALEAAPDSPGDASDDDGAAEQIYMEAPPPQAANKRRAVPVGHLTVVRERADMAPAATGALELLPRLDEQRELLAAERLAAAEQQQRLQAEQQRLQAEQKRLQAERLAAAEQQQQQRLQAEQHQRLQQAEQHQQQQRLHAEQQRLQAERLAAAEQQQRLQAEQQRLQAEQQRLQAEQQQQQQQRLEAERARMAAEHEQLRRAEAEPHAAERDRAPQPGNGGLVMMGEYAQRMIEADGKVGGLEERLESKYEERCRAADDLCKLLDGMLIG